MVSKAIATLENLFEDFSVNLDENQCRGCIYLNIETESVAYGERMERVECVTCDGAYDVCPLVERTVDEMFDQFKHELKPITREVKYPKGI